MSAPSAEPGQELGTSQQESDNVRERCASDLWVVCDPRGCRGRGGEQNLPQRRWDWIWDFSAASSPRLCVGEWGQIQRHNLPRVSSYIKWWLLIKAD